MTPCLCRGTMRYIHTECLLEWIKSSNSLFCGICKYKFRFKRVYKMGTPRRVPASCILSALCSSTAQLLFRLFCLAYFIAKVSFVLAFNAMVFSSCFFEGTAASDWFAMVPLGTIASVVNLFHSYFCRSVRRVMKSSRRMRINTRRALETMASDIVSRAGSDAVTQAMSSVTSDPGINENSIEENSSEDSSSEVADVLSGSVYGAMRRAPTLASLGMDVAQIASFTWVSFVILLVSALTGRMHRLSFMQKIFYAFRNMTDRISMPFVDSCAVVASLACIHVFTLCLALLCGLFYLLQPYCRRFPARLLHGCIKVYLFTHVAMVYLFVLSGVIAHASIAVFVNGGAMAFSTGSVVISLIAHGALGLCIVRFLKKIEENVTGRMRPGLRNNSLADMKVSTIIRYGIERSAGVFVWKCFVKILSVSVLVVGTVALQSRLCPAFTMIDDWEMCLYFKLFAMGFSVSGEFMLFLCAIYAGVMRVLVPLLGMENYLYNKMMDKCDRRFLVWDLNGHAPGEAWERQLRQINRVCRIRTKADAKAAANAAGSSTGLGPNEAAAVSAAEENPSRGISKPNTKLKESIKANERTNERILRKYAFTARRIEKYFGRKHSGKFGIFYKPRFYWIRKAFIFLSCIAATQAVLFALLSLARFLVGSLCPASGQGRFFMFTALALLRAVSFAARMCWGIASDALAAACKSFALHCYTNILWPTAASAFVLLAFCDSSVIIHFSKVFIFFNAFSSVIHTIFVFGILAMPLERYALHHIVSRLTSFVFLKFIVIMCYAGYRHVLSMRLALGLLAVSYGCTRLLGTIKQMATGAWLENIKDRYFLERKIVLNYPPEDGDAANSTD